MSRNDDTTVRFCGLKPGRYSYVFKLDDTFFERYENDELRGGNVVIKAEMGRLEHNLMFHFHLEGELTTWCDRCLGELRVPVEGDDQLCVRFSDSETSDDEEVAVLPEKATEIDLSQWLYEFVAVRLPMQHRHSEGDCDPEMTRFIVPDEVLAKPENETDPRWDALKKLK